MNVFVQDSQVVPDTEGQLFEMLQQGPTSVLLQLRNAGNNTMNYRFQEFNGTAWVDLGVLGTDANNTLSAAQVKQFKLSSNYPQVRCLGYASGGAVLEFSVTRFFNRSSGATIPMLNL
jgi:hypothetical protein